MLSIARSEIIQMFRNRLVLVTSLIMPVAVSIFFISNRDTFAEVGGLGYIAAVIVFIVAAFGMYATAVTTLAGRRQTLFLKRLRSTSAGDGAILSGLVLPVVALGILQVGAILAVLATVSEPPSNIGLLVIGIAATFLMMIAFALATAGVTNSPEHAQVTSLPLSLAVIGVASWVGIAGTEELTAVKRALPGGAATELLVEAWSGTAALGDSLVLLAPTLAWVVIAIVSARSMFRWEPRR